MEQKYKVMVVRMVMIVFIAVIILFFMSQCSKYETPEEKFNNTNRRWEDILNNKTCYEVYEMFKTEGSRGKCPERIGACSVERMKEIFRYKQCNQYSIMVER